MDADNSDFVLLVIDDASLRRAELIGFLCGWASDHELKVIGVDAERPLSVMEYASCRMCVLNCGATFMLPRYRNILRVLHGLDAARPVVVMADSDSPDEIKTALGHGARGYIPTYTDPSLAIHALSFILQGGAYFPPSALAATQGQLEPPPPRRHLRQPDDASAVSAKDNGGRRDRPQQAAGNDGDPRDSGQSLCSGSSALTERQGEVLVKLKMGLSNKAIARDLEMSEATVKVHVRQLMRKLGAANRTQAALIAARRDAAGTATPDTGAPAAAAAQVPAETKTAAERREVTPFPYGARRREPAVPSLHCPDRPSLARLGEVASGGAV